MAMAIGTRLGSYEILSALGAGGMGEVYRARDTTLGRDVALKTLPASCAGDPERLARFEREAKTLASLNHPHIAQIYGFERAGDTCALVMELVEGEDCHSGSAAERCRSTRPCPSRGKSGRPSRRPTNKGSSTGT
jgi:serine/threonine protein kinase